MGWLEDLKREIPELSITSSAAKGANKAPKHPRDNVVLLLKNSLSFLNDPNFKFAAKGGTTKTPETCYKIDGTMAHISISFSRSKLSLDGQGNEITVPSSRLKDVIVRLIAAVEAKSFDEQLDKIQKDRKASQANAKPKTKKAS